MPLLDGRSSRWSSWIALLLNCFNRCDLCFVDFILITCLFTTHVTLIVGTRKAHRSEPLLLLQRSSGNVKIRTEEIIKMERMRGEESKMF